MSDEVSKEIGRLSANAEHTQRNISTLWEQMDEVKKIVSGMNVKLDLFIQTQTSIQSKSETASEKQAKQIEDLNLFKTRILTIHGALMATGGAIATGVWWVVENLRSALPKIGG